MVDLDKVSLRKKRDKRMIQILSWDPIQWEWLFFRWDGWLENSASTGGLHGLPPVAWRMGVRRSSDGGQLLGGLGTAKIRSYSCEVNMSESHAYKRFPIVMATYKNSSKSGRGDEEGESEPWLWEEGCYRRSERDFFLPYYFLYANWCNIDMFA